MKRYQQQLLGALERSRWELVEVLGPADWWSQEHWRLRPVPVVPPVAD